MTPTTSRLLRSSTALRRLPSQALAYSKMSTSNCPSAPGARGGEEVTGAGQASVGHRSTHPAYAGRALTLARRRGGFEEGYVRGACMCVCACVHVCLLPPPPPGLPECLARRPPQ
eukprot:5303755-Alexandrium_andersonii.AAC.1